MKRVRVYEPEIIRKQDGRKTIQILKNKRGKLISERSVMDRTLKIFQDANNEFIINQKQFMEEITEDMKKEELSSKNRDQLAKEAESLGIKVADSNKEETIINSILKKIGFKK